MSKVFTSINEDNIAVSLTKTELDLILSFLVYYDTKNNNKMNIYDDAVKDLFVKLFQIKSKTLHELVLDTVFDVNLAVVELDGKKVSSNKFLITSLKGEK